MSQRSPPTVALLSAPDTLEGIDPLLRKAGVRLIRLASVAPRPVDPIDWLPRLRRAPTPDTVVVTSQFAVSAGVRPWRRAAGPLPASLEFWAVGPGTAEALRRVGAGRICRPPTVGAMAIATSLGRTPRRTIVYFRSNVAGPRVARALRLRGHRVVDLVVYRLDTPPPLTARERRKLTAANLLVVTSPSGLLGLKRRLDRRTFSRLRRTARLVVLGERSRWAARRHGFRHCSLAPSTTAQRFTRHLLRELRNAPK
jgi:uroporphyrinogen-III synthase